MGEMRMQTRMESLLSNLDFSCKTRCFQRLAGRHPASLARLSGRLFRSSRRLRPTSKLENVVLALTDRLGGEIIHLKLQRDL